MREIRGLLGKPGQWRTDTLDGRDYIVVPVVALVEGVVHAMNAATPELVTEAEFSRAPASWNTRPVYYAHPMEGDRPVSGGSIELYASKRIGLVFNTTLKPKKLCMEAWLDIEKCEEVDPKILERVKSGDPIEISIGAFVETDDVKGEFRGVQYDGVWHDIVPDHLALLPEGETGACSRDMGCGVRAAKKGSLMASTEKKEEKKNGFLVRMMQMFRGNVSATESDRDQRDDLMDAVREMEPNCYDIVAFYTDRVVYVVFGPEGVCLYQRAYTGDQASGYKVDGNRVEVEPVTTYEPVGLTETDVTTAAGKRNSKADQEKIQAAHDSMVALGANCDPKMTSAAPTAASQCGCGGSRTANDTNKGDNAMANEKSKTERVAALIGKSIFVEADKAMLEAATEEQLVRFEAAAAAPVAPKTPETPAVVEPKAAAVVATPTVAEQPKAATFEDVLKTASSDVQQMVIDGIRIAKDRKAATIKALKDTTRCDYSDEELGAMTQGQLDKALKLAGVPEAKTSGVDFSGLGMARNDQSKDVAPAPDLHEAIRAANAAKNGVKA